MYNIALFSSIGVSVLAIIYSVFLAVGISSKSAGSKKIFDVAKIMSDELKQKQSKNIKDLALVAIILFTGIMYAFGWQAAVCFLFGALVFGFFDYYLMDLSTKTTVRLAEAAKSGTTGVYKLAANFSLASTLLLSGSGLLAVSVVYFVFKDPTTLLVLALSAILVAFFSWRSGKLNFLGSFVATIVVVIVLAQGHISTYSNTELLPLIFTAFIILITAISTIFFRFGSKNLNILAGFRRATIALSVLFLAGAYFGAKYLLADSSKLGTIKLAVILAIGLLLAIATLFVRQISKVLPTLAVAVAILVASFFAGIYGVSLIAIGFLALWPLVFIINSLAHVAKNAGVIVDSAQMPVEVAENIEILENNKIKTNSYFISLFGIIAINLLSLYFLEFVNTKFLATDLKFLSGLLFGAALSYLLSSELFRNKILKIAVVVFAAIIAGLTLGPVLLAGVLAGAILIDLLVSQVVSSEVLVMTIVGILSAGFIENQYSLMVRGIMAGAVLVLVAIYFVTEKFYGKGTGAGK